jgi:hypothetical protein
LYHIDMGRDRIFSFFMLKTFPHPITTQSPKGGEIFPVVQKKACTSIRMPGF